jgi:parvulin-like peptidyl-prolyl isomerase
LDKKHAALAWVILVAAGCSRPAAPLASASADPSPQAAPGAPPAIDRVTPLPSPLPDIVARVNGEAVSIRQVLGLARKALQHSKEREKDTPGAVRQAMHQYIERELLFQEAMARGISADTRRVEAAYDEVRGGFKDEQRFAESLADQGLDTKAFKQELRVQETVNAFIARVTTATTVTEEEVKTYFDAHARAFDPGEKLEVRHILFRIPKGTTERVKETIRVKAGVAANRAASGEDFVTLARALSEDPDEKARGRLIEMRRGMMPLAFEQAAFALEPGQVSGLVEIPGGLSVIKLEKRIPGPPAQFEDVQAAVRAEALREKRQAVFRALVSSLRAKARIETYL